MTEQEIIYAKFVAILAKPMGSEQNDLMHAAAGVAGEAGEIIDAVKKYWCYNKPLDRENMKEELGDIRFYIQMFYNLLGFTEEEIIESNMEKLKKRYPQGYTDAAAQARADKVEGQ